MTYQDIVTQFLAQIPSSAVLIYLIQWMKTSHLFKFVSEETTKLNRCLMLCGSAITAIGIHYTYNPQDGVITITGVTLLGIAHGLWHWVNSAALTQLIYDGVVKESPNASGIVTTHSV